MITVKGKFNFWIKAKLNLAVIKSKFKVVMTTNPIKNNILENSAR